MRSFCLRLVLFPFKVLFWLLGTGAVLSISLSLSLALLISVPFVIPFFIYVYILAWLKSGTLLHSIQNVDDVARAFLKMRLKADGISPKQ